MLVSPWQYILTHINWSKRTRLTFTIVQFFIVLTLIISALAGSRLTFNADILALLPQSQQSQLLTLGEKYFFDNSRTQIVFSFSGEDSELAYDQMAIFLKQRQYKLAGDETPKMSDVTAFYAPFNGAVLSDYYQQNISSYQLIHDNIMRQLSQTADPFVSSSFALDPSLNLASFLRERFSHLSSLQQHQGRFITTEQGQTIYLLFATVPKDKLGIKASQVVSTEILDKVSQLALKLPSVEIIHSGFVFHTAQNAQQAEFEMTVFGGISMTLLSLMVLLVFRSLKPLLLALATVTNALLFGFGAVFSLFDSIHLLSLVFAVTLIGIAIDYCFHMLSDSLLSENVQPKVSDSVITALCVGCITTVAGYALLLGSPLTMLSQVAVFVMFGLFGALVFVVLIAPLVLKERKVMPSQASWAFVDGVQRKLAWLNSHRKNVVSIVFVAIACTVWFKPLSFDDDVRLLNASSDTLIKNERINLQRLGKFAQTRLYITANNFEQLLVREERVIAQIREFKPQLQVDALSNWVPSQTAQQRNLLQVKRAINDNVFASISNVLGVEVTITPAAGFLTEQVAFSSPLKAVFDSKAVRLEQGYVSWLSLESLPKEALESLLLQHQKYLFVFDKASDISNSLRTYRSEIIWLQSLALALVLAVFSLKFGVKIAIKQVTILGLSIALALISVAIVQGSLNIFNMLALLLVIALGIDYLVFYQSQGLSRNNVLAILLSACSSILVFGMLAMSKTPAVFSFGITVMCGIIAVYLLAPLSVTFKQNHE